jgi:predicted exporter
MDVLLQPTASFDSSHLVQTTPDERQTQTPNLQSQITRVINSISDRGLRVSVERILGDLVFMLDWLSLIGEDCSTRDEVEKALWMVEAAAVDAHSLVSFIEDNAMQLEGLDDAIREAFDSSAYAISLELKQIFGSESTPSTLDIRSKAIKAALVHAQGVLKNCFQHCLIELMQVFDQNSSCSQLYSDLWIRRERSMLLCRELAALIEVVAVSDLNSAQHIIRKLVSFRENGMHWLMYRDWDDYESLSGQVIEALNKKERCVDLLHRLACYLETLLAQVKTRAVLR